MEQGGKKRREDEPEERERERGEVAFVISLSSPSVRASPTKLLFLIPYFTHMRTSHPVSLSYFEMNSNELLIFGPLLSTLSYFIDMNQLP